MPGIQKSHEAKFNEPLLGGASKTTDLNSIPKIHLVENAKSRLVDTEDFPMRLFKIPIMSASLKARASSSALKVFFPPCVLFGMQRKRAGLFGRPGLDFSLTVRMRTALLNGRAFR